MTVKYQVKTFKFKIAYDKFLYEVLRDVMYANYRIKNLATTMAYDWQQFSFAYNTRFGEYPKEKDVIGGVLTTDIDRVVREMDEYKFMAAHIRSVSVRDAVNFFKQTNVKKELLSGNRVLQTYRRTGSFPMRATLLNDIRKEATGKYAVDMTLLSIQGRKEHGLKIGQIEAKLIGSRRANASHNVMIERVINGDEGYTMSDSKISYDERKRNFYLMLAIKFPKQQVVADESKVMGIDLGIAVPAVIATNFDGWYREFVGSAQEIRDFERQVESRKRRLSKSRKWAGSGNSGRGYKKRTEAVNKIADKISRFKDTKNHQWSKYIVDEAARLGCGVIQMEDLTGITDGGDQFLKRWTYFDLQTKITYKAEALGIKVVKISPKYTSARCNKCGCVHVDVDKSLWRPTQDTFKCVTCGHEDNADVNAAKNIAMPDIEAIIKEYLYHAGKTK